MTTTWRWTAATATLAVLVVAVEQRALVGPVTPPWLAYKLVYGAGYLLFGAALLGAVARWLPSLYPAVWRPLALSMGAAAAAAQVLIQHGDAPAALNVDRWMVALLGLALPALLARWAPDRWLRVWLGTDRRGP